MDMRKFRAICIASLLILNAYGIIYFSVAQNAFVQAASDTYTIRNIIYINATGLSKAPYDVIRLEISESVELDPKPSPPIKGIAERSFTPDTDIDTQRVIKAFYERQSITESFEFNGQTYIINTTAVTPAYLFIAQLGNGTILPINMSTWINAGFETPQFAFPAMEKTVVFDSPLHYAVAYCADHGFIFRNIINSTYQRIYNMNTLNTFHSQLLKEDFIIYNANTSETMAMPMGTQYGGELVTQDLGIGAIIAIVVAICLTAIAIPTIAIWLYNEYALQGLKASLDAAAGSLADSVNKTKQIADSLTGAKTAERAMVLEFYNNGTITWEQLQFLLKQIDGSYNPLINNCTANIAAMTAAYFNSTVELYGEYTNGLMAASSWTSWITPLITLIIALIVAYCVYALVSKIKGASGSTQTINLTKL